MSQIALWGLPCFSNRFVTSRSHNFGFLISHYLSVFSSKFENFKFHFGVTNLVQDLSWLSGSTWSGVSSCLYPRCDEKAWSNEYPVYLSTSKWKSRSSLRHIFRDHFLVFHPVFVFSCLTEVVYSKSVSSQCIWGFGMLQPGQDYTVVCYITDPWFNQVRVDQIVCGLSIHF